MYVKTSIPYTKVESIHYKTLSKKGTIWKIDVNNLSVSSLQVLLLLFLDKRDDFTNKNEEFYNPSIKKIIVMINGVLINFLRLDYRLGTFIRSWKNIFTRNMGRVFNGKICLMDWYAVKYWQHTSR